MIIVITKNQGDNTHHNCYHPFFSLIWKLPIISAIIPLEIPDYALMYHFAFRDCKCIPIVIHPDFMRAFPISEILKTIPLD